MKMKSITDKDKNRLNQTKAAKSDKRAMAGNQE